MSKKKFSDRVNNKHIKIVLGTILILFSVYGLINYTFPANAITFGLIFLFGNLYFLVYALLIYIGLNLICGNFFKGHKLTLTIVGLILFVISLGAALTYSIDSLKVTIDEEVKTFSGNQILLDNYNLYFTNLSGMKYVMGMERSKEFVYGYGGGYLGYLLVAMLNTIHPTVTLVFIISMFTLSVVFFMFYPIRLLVTYVKKNSNVKVNKFKKAKKDKDEIIEDIQKVQDEDELFNDKDIDLDEPIEEIIQEEDPFELQKDEIDVFDEEDEIESFRILKEQKEQAKLERQEARELKEQARIEAKEQAKLEKEAIKLEKSKENEVPQIDAIVEEDNLLIKPVFGFFEDDEEITGIKKETMGPIKEEVAEPVVEVKQENNDIQFAKPGEVIEEKDLFEEIIEEEPIQEQEEIDSSLENEQFNDTEIAQNEFNYVSENTKEEIIEDSSSYEYEDTLETNDDIEENIEEDEIIKEPVVETTQKIVQPSIAQSMKDNKISVDSNKNSAFNFSDRKVEKQEQPVKKIVYKYPSSSFLTDRQPDEDDVRANKEDNDLKLAQINDIFKQLGVGASSNSYTIGPSVTRFDIVPDANVSVSQIEKYINDVSSRLGGVLARFEKIVQGKTTSALEIPNEKSSMVGFKAMFEDLPKLNPQGDLRIPFGMGIDGKYVSGNLAKFPHMLVSGASGSGKSVFIHSLVMTLIMRNSPEQLKLLLIDPKEVELSKYDGIPHLLCPVVSDGLKSKIALERLCDEMDARYKILKEIGVTDLAEYNEYAREEHKPELPYIVVVIDEFADLVEVEKSITSPVTRLAQKARASGIHMVIATQRPSTNVVTGIIKSNITVRVALMASSNVDSRVMLDQGGAENLVGNGDMLVMCSSITRNGLIRCQGAYLTSSEIRKVVYYLRENYGTQFDDNFLNLTVIDEMNAIPSNNASISNRPNDPLYEDVREFAYSQEFMSISSITRNFNVGFNRGGKLLKMLENHGVISSEGEVPSRGKPVVIHSEPEYLDHLESMGQTYVDGDDFNGSEEE